jgi:uncharacterized membrane protein YraQ (UPF0718 family)
MRHASATLSARSALVLVLGAAVWVTLYRSLLPAAEAIVAHLPVVPASRLADALTFFLYDAPKVLLLLAGVVFAMGIVNASFTPERTRALLARRGGVAGNAMAAALGVVTPFCSCSAVPLFIGFVQAGVPLGITFSFLIAAPMVNEVALALLVGLFGWRIALLYLVLGLVVAIVAGYVLGRLRLERFVEDWVRAMPRAAPRLRGNATPADDWVRIGVAAVRDVVGRVWIYVLAGIAVGALIHGYVPQDFMAGIMGRDAWWSVPLAVVLGVPMYANAAGILPIVEALLAKGAALGTALAFMMSVIALSLPEMIILRKVLKPRLIAAFAGIVASGIMLVGFVFNAVH